MALIHFFYLDSQGNCQECSYIGQNMDDCLEALSTLAGAGWQLIGAEFLERSASNLWLPIKAFDGIPIKESLRKLQREWEMVLTQQ